MFCTKHWALTKHWAGNGKLYWFSRIFHLKLFTCPNLWDSRIGLMNTLKYIGSHTFEGGF